MLSSCDYWPHPGRLSLSDQWDPLCVLAWVLCVCARVRVCIHALTWVTAELRCWTRSSPSSDCIVHLDLNFILAKNKTKQGCRHHRLECIPSEDCPVRCTLSCLHGLDLGLHLERKQTVQWEDVDKEERRARC